MKLNCSPCNRCHMLTSQFYRNTRDIKRHRISHVRKTDCTETNNYIWKATILVAAFGSRFPRSASISKWATTWQNQQNECAPSKTQISLGIRPVWSESSLCAQWVAKDPSFLHADSEESDQTGRMPRLIGVFAGRTTILLVLSCRSSNEYRAESVDKSSSYMNVENLFPPDFVANSASSPRWPATVFCPITWGFITLLSEILIQSQH